MRRGEAVRILGEHASDQWGLVTAAQAKLAGVNGVELLRLGEAGLLHSVGRGVYQVIGAAVPEHLEIKVAWLRLDPERYAWQRAQPGTWGGVVSHGSACELHRIGDIPASEVEISVPRRRTTRGPGVRLRMRELDTADVVLVDGLPVTTPEQTIVDLLAARADGGHVGGIIADAEHRGLVTVDAVAERIARFAVAYGMRRGTSGEELIQYLVGQAGTRLRARGPQHDAEVAMRGFLSALALVLPKDRLNEMIRNLLSPSTGLPPHQSRQLAEAQQAIMRAALPDLELLPDRKALFPALGQHKALFENVALTDSAAMAARQIPRVTAARSPASDGPEKAVPQESAEGEAPG
jgi:predicted transcriptional regulator of viral defense system